MVFYMSSWYAPSCQRSDFTRYRIYRGNQDETLIELFGTATDRNYPAEEKVVVSDKVQVDSIFAVNDQQIKKCISTKDGTIPVGVVTSYCPDILEDLLRLWNNTGVPLLIQVGDAPSPKASRFVNNSNYMLQSYSSIPHFAKTRAALASDMSWIETKRALQRQPPEKSLLPQRIIWKLNTRRHFGGLGDLHLIDIPWAKKKNVSVFRGITTGKRAPRKSKLSVEQKCRLQQRCAIVDKYSNSLLVDAKLVRYPSKKMMNQYPASYYGQKLTRTEMLQYKALIMLQGNDVSSGLKWAMMSNSVVIMPAPTVSSWFMEELLRPYIHYVPIKADLSDVEEQMRWIIENDLQAQKIAQRGSLWVKDMLFHDDAMADEREIKAEILSRYGALFTGE